MASVNDKQGNAACKLRVVLLQGADPVPRLVYMPHMGQQLHKQHVAQMIAEEKWVSAHRHRNVKGIGAGAVLGDDIHDLLVAEVVGNALRLLPCQPRVGGRRDLHVLILSDVAQALLEGLQAPAATPAC